MMRLRLQDIASAMQGARLHADTAFTGLSTDTRQLGEDCLFVALRGPNFDGHDYLQQARAGGAAALLCEYGRLPDAPGIEVPDSRRALGELARHWRRRMPARLVAITGSNGKTTSKQMLAAILSQVGPTLATRGNLNNEIGVPLTLAELTPEHAFGVIEMGASAAGEIAWLVSLAEPEVGVVLNAGPAHLEGFGSLQGVAEAKGEMFSGLPADGIAVINADDSFATLWHDMAGVRRRVTVSLAGEADLRGETLAGGGLRLHWQGERVDLHLPVPGTHNQRNALSAAAAALALEVPLATVATGLEAFEPEAGRLQLLSGPNGSCLIDDSYNANPSSLRAGIDVLLQQGLEPWLVLGDMAELGPESSALHAAAGHTAREAGVTRLYAVGPLSVAAVDAFGAGGRHFKDKTGLQATLQQELHGGVAVLIKGSRSAGMDQLVRALGAPQRGAEEAG
ncbi:UDP-N-acetylmuramoyl-tripeptide--D-alanyl-D-alanine ligase [Methylonatrum kenyense]|uniref:UDP-N-acetylmuramoyl-tripeptide--D-alanyl-D- alanine ligase n=1 Tax=Methylonatrum kenyense TaxID=455253 RepID=UPI0020C07945|nr:UDP-N-acetylmuramoyl-tripeptide--D-alanyl-D-alanine ligase [Methylonatrum kenyense]MCK8516288.1 UDP-N-acetylmuramoyl-tripeptide--D-alanyl-D-alanine ligase [Methylonatrum kenyense]